MSVIATTHGEMDEAALERRDGELNDDNEHTTWVEYYLGEELVHRSVHVTLKVMPSMAGEAGGVG